MAGAQEQFESIELFAWAFMTNHFHMMLRGKARDVPAFMASIKRELTRRWGGSCGRKNTLWAERYKSTALPTEQSQRDCLPYVLQGVKEGIVDRPERWPGLHVAHQLFRGEPLVGHWTNGTTYKKAKFKDEARQTPRGVDRADHVTVYEVRLDRLPAFAEYSKDEYRHALLELEESIVTESAWRAPPSRNYLRSITARRFEHMTELPRLPWWEDRRRMIHWAAHDAPETVAYRDRYWTR